MLPGSSCLVLPLRSSHALLLLSALPDLYALCPPSAASPRPQADGNDSEVDADEVEWAQQGGGGGAISDEEMSDVSDPDLEELAAAGTPLCTVVL